MTRTAPGYFLSGNVTGYLIGIAVLVFTFVALPPADRREPRAHSREP